MAEWTHPRRAAKETISYLSQIEPVLDQFDEDTRGYERSGGEDGGDDEDDDVGREQMLDNVLEELKHQTASIMEDRKGSVVAEKIARRLTPSQLRVVLSRCSGYILSLANNRYSSHVLQTLLSYTGHIIEAERSSSDDGQGFVIDTEGDRGGCSDGSNGDLLQATILSLVSELSGTWAELLADISGSHVGRAFLQVLGGLPILTEQRGKQSRHAHSIGSAVGPSGRARSNNTGMPGDPTKPAVDPEALDKWSTPHKYRVPTSFKTALNDVTTELRALPAGELQALACGTFGCPLLVMLLRVYGNLAVDPESGQLPCLGQGSSPAMTLVEKVLEWGDEGRSEEVVYAMSGENTASHFLEAVLWLSPANFFRQLYQRCFERKLLEFCQHGVSNFLIQAALQRVDDKALGENMVDAIAAHATPLLAGGRAGVIWRAAQACVRLNLKPKSQRKLVDAIAQAVQTRLAGGGSAPAQEGDAGGGEGDATGGGAKTASPPSDTFQAARAWVPALLSPRLPGEGGLDRLFLNVPGARIVQNVLRFEPAVAAPVLKAVAALPENVLAAIARDNLGSRCLLDPILEAAGAGGGGTKGGSGGKNKNRPAEDARRTILRAFRGHLVAMACDRIAWHVLLKCFRGVDMKEKRAMTEELASAGEQACSRMSGYPSGRSVMTECMVERFSRSPHEWEEAFKNRDNRAKMLDDILAVESGKKSANKGATTISAATAAGNTAPAANRAQHLAPSPFNTLASKEQAGPGESQRETTENGDGVKTKEKRRRQRGRGKRGKSSAGGTAVDDGDEGEAHDGGAIDNDEIEDVPEPTAHRQKDATPANAAESSVFSKKQKKSVDGIEQADELSRSSSSKNGKRMKGELGGDEAANGGEPKPGKAKKSKKSRLSSHRGTEEGTGDIPSPEVNILADVPREEEEGEEAASPPASKKKKKKRSRQDVPHEGKQVEATAQPPQEADVDLSFVLDAIKKTASSQSGADEDGQHHGQSDKEKKKGDKKKSKRRRDEGGEREINAVGDLSNRKEPKGEEKEDVMGSSNNNAGDTALKIVETKSRSRKGAGSSSEKRKKSSSGSGFRMF